MATLYVAARFRISNHICQASLDSEYNEHELKLLASCIINAQAIGSVISELMKTRGFKIEKHTAKTNGNEERSDHY